MEEQFTTYDFKRMHRRSYYPHNQQIISQVTATSSTGFCASRPVTPITPSAKDEQQHTFPPLPRDRTLSSHGSHNTPVIQQSPTMPGMEKVEDYGAPDMLYAPQTGQFQSGHSLYLNTTNYGQSRTGDERSNMRGNGSSANINETERAYGP